MATNRKGGLLLRSSNTPQRRRGEGGFTLAEVLVGVVFVVLLVALLTPALARVSRQHKVEECAAHLKALHAAQRSFYSKATAAPELGKAYWENLAKASPPAIEARTLLCPLMELEGAPAVQYMGPAADPRSVAGADPIGCDLDVNHGHHGHEGGNILLSSGDVVNDNAREKGLWGAAQSKNCRY